MSLNTNDTFQTKQEALNAIKLYTSHTPYLYTSQTTTTKHHTLYCKGKDDFNCDAHISISFRKKDNLYVVKRIKTVHKCPLDIHNNSTTTLQYLRQEILHLSDPRKEHRLGDIVLTLLKRNIKVGYHTVWKALNYEKCYSEGDREEVEDSKLEGDSNNTTSNGNNTPLSNNTTSNGNNIPLSNNTSINPITNTLYPSINNTSTSSLLTPFLKYSLISFKNELLSLNTNIICYTSNTNIYISIPHTLLYTRPVVELKVYERTYNNCLVGHVIYSILYDTNDKPVIYSFMVSEGPLSDNLKEYCNYTRGVKGSGECVSNRGNEQQGVSNSTDNYKGVSNSSNEQQGVNDSTNKQHPPNTTKKNTPLFFIVEMDNTVIQILESINFPYFIKTRDVCKEGYNYYKDKGVIPKIWEICNRPNIGSIYAGVNTHKDSSMFNTPSITNTSSLTPSPFSNNPNNTQFDCTGIDSVMSYMPYNSSKYMCMLFPYPLFSLNNMCELDVECVYYSVYSLSFYECVNCIVKMVSEYMKGRGVKCDVLHDKILKGIERSRGCSIKGMDSELEGVNGRDNELEGVNTNTDTLHPFNTKTDNLHPFNNSTLHDNNITDKENIPNNTNKICTSSDIKYRGRVYENGNIFTVNLKECTCTCGKYQLLLIPCCHAIHFIRSIGDDVLRHVSCFYSEEFNKMIGYDIVPVVNEPVKVPCDKVYFNRKPGRPKRVKIEGGV